MSKKDIQLGVEFRIDPPRPTVAELELALQNYEVKGVKVFDDNLLKSTLKREDLDNFIHKWQVGCIDICPRIKFDWVHGGADPYYDLGSFVIDFYTEKVKPLLESSYGPGWEKPLKYILKHNAGRCYMRAVKNHIIVDHRTVDPHGGGDYKPMVFNNKGTSLFLVESYFDAEVYAKKNIRDEEEREKFLLCYLGGHKRFEARPITYIDYIIESIIASADTEADPELVHFDNLLKKTLEKTGMKNAMLYLIAEEFMIGGHPNYVNENRECVKLLLPYTVASDSESYEDIIMLIIYTYTSPKEILTVLFQEETRLKSNIGFNLDRKNNRPYWTLMSVIEKVCRDILKLDNYSYKSLLLEKVARTHPEDSIFNYK